MFWGCHERVKLKLRNVYMSLSALNKKKGLFFSFHRCLQTACVSYLMKDSSLNMFQMQSIYQTDGRQHFFPFFCCKRYCSSFTLAVSFLLLGCTFHSPQTSLLTRQQIGYWGSGGKHSMAGDIVWFWLGVAAGRTRLVRLIFDVWWGMYCRGVHFVYTLLRLSLFSFLPVRFLTLLATVRSEHCSFSFSFLGVGYIFSRWWWCWRDNKLKVGPGGKSFRYISVWIFLKLKIV